MEIEKQPGIRFLGVELLQIHFDITGPLSQPLRAGISFDVDAELSEDEEKLDLILKTDVFGGLAENERPPLDLTFTLVAQFEATAGNELSLREFAEHNGPAYMMPYVRELLADITTRSPLPTLNIGPINIIALAKKGKAKFEISQKEKPAQEV